MARDEVGRRARAARAWSSVLAIMIILLAVVALVVVNALKHSPWGAFTIAMTIPIAHADGRLHALPAARARARGLGDRLRRWCSFGRGRRAVGRALARVGAASSRSPARRSPLAVIVYGFAASALPVWLLLAPRDYLSAFIKVGRRAGPRRSASCWCGRRSRCRRSRASSTAAGPVFAGTIFPFCFITIACGAISGFHALISSGTTPKLLMRESDARARRLRLDADGVASWA